MIVNWRSLFTEVVDSKLSMCPSKSCLTQLSDNRTFVWILRVNTTNTIPLTNPWRGSRNSCEWCTESDILYVMTHGCRFLGPYHKQYRKLCWPFMKLGTQIWEEYKKYAGPNAKHEVEKWEKYQFLVNFLCQPENPRLCLHQFDLHKEVFVAHNYMHFAYKMCPMHYILIVNSN